MPINLIWANGNPIDLAFYQRVEDASGIGWYSINAAAGYWTYASALTINVPAGALNFYQKGDKIRYKQGGGWKYGNIVAVADALLTVTGGSDYSVANASITDIYISRAENPFGWPGWFNYAPTTGGVTTPAVGNPLFRIQGNECIVSIDYITGTSSATTFTFTLPVAPAINYTSLKLIGVKDNGAYAIVTGAQQGHLEIAAAPGLTVDMYKSFYRGVWTNTGGKGAYIGVFSYRI